MKHFLQITFLLGAVLLVTGNALAHKVNLFAYVEGQTVFTESYFPDGRPVEEGKILVYDSQDNLLLTGATDTEGLFDFAAPKVDDLKIVLEAGMGHRTEFTLSQTDLEADE